MLMIRDPEIIKQVTVKDFDSFMNHKMFFTESNEPLFGKNIFALKGTYLSAKNQQVTILLVNAIILYNL